MSNIRKKEITPEEQLAQFEKELKALQKMVEALSMAEVEVITSSINISELLEKTNQAKPRAKVRGFNGIQSFQSIFKTTVVG